MVLLIILIAGIMLPALDSIVNSMLMLAGIAAAAAFLRKKSSYMDDYITSCKEKENRFR